MAGRTKRGTTIQVSPEVKRDVDRLKPIPYERSDHLLRRWGQFVQKKSRADVTKFASSEAQ